MPSTNIPFDPTEHQANYTLYLRYVTLVSVAIASWEHLIWLPREFEIWKRLLIHRRSVFSSLIVLAIRYSLQGASVCAALFFFGRPSSCQATLSMLWVMFTLCWIAIIILFGTRVWIIWGKKQWVAILISFVGLLSVAAWVVVDSQWRAVDLRALVGPTDPICAQAYEAKWHMQRWHQINWGASMAFDSVVLILTFIRLQTLPIGISNSSNSNMRQYILRSNLGYFAVSFAINFAAFIAQMTVKNIDIAQLPTPLAFTLVPIVAARVIFATSANRDEHTNYTKSQSSWWSHQIKLRRDPHGHHTTSGSTAGGNGRAEQSTQHSASGFGAYPSSANEPYEVTVKMDPSPYGSPEARPSHTYEPGGRRSMSSSGTPYSGTGVRPWNNAVLIEKETFVSH